MPDIVITIVYACLGIILMMVGNMLIDVVIPCDFPVEIKRETLH